MTDYVTSSGLVVTDRRHDRSDPRSWPPNDNPDPDPPVSVGPTSSEGFGNTHVMYPDPTVGVAPRSPIHTPPVMPWSGWPVEWATPTWGGAVGIGECMLRASTVFTSLDVNSRILATMPPYKLTAGKLSPSVAWMSNPQPEVYTGWVEAMKQVVYSFQMGEVFLWATSRYEEIGPVRTWVVMSPTWINVELDGRIERYNIVGGGPEIPSADMLHIKYASWPGDARGHGPLESLAYNLFGAEALERYASNLANRGGVPWATLTAPGNLNKEQALSMRESFVSARLSANGAPAVLSGGIKLDVLSFDPRAMALLELRQFNEARIAVALGVPPHLVGLPSGGDPMTYTNVNSIYDYHWRSGLRPMAQHLMEAISNWALPRGSRVELNRDEYTRPDFGTRVTGYATLFNIIDETTGERAITIPEIRAAERLNVTEDTLPVGSSSLSVPL